MEVTVATRDTQSPGEFWEMAKSLVDRLPKGSSNYHKDPQEFNRLVGLLVKLDPHSDELRQIEAILTGKAPVQHIETTRNPIPPMQRKLAHFLPKGYESARGEELANRLKASRPGINLEHLDQLIASCKMHEGADGIYAAPKVSYEAMLLGLTLEESRRQFGQLIEAVCQVLASQRKFVNYREGELGPERLEVVDRTWDALMWFEQNQPGDVIVYSGGTGSHSFYAGRRPDWSRWEMEHSPDQWPFSPFEGGWALVGNPHRLEHYEHLVIDLPGVRYRFDPAGEFDSVLCFGFGSEGLYLVNGDADNPNYHCGSGGGFLQQSLPLAG